MIGVWTVKHVGKDLLGIQGRIEDFKTEPKKLVSLQSLYGNYFLKISAFYGLVYFQVNISPVIWKKPLKHIFQL